MEGIIEKGGRFEIDWDKLTAYAVKTYRNQKQRELYIQSVQEEVNRRNEKSNERSYTLLTQ